MPRIQALAGERRWAGHERQKYEGSFSDVGHLGRRILKRLKTGSALPKIQLNLMNSI